MANRENINGEYDIGSNDVAISSPLMTNHRYDISHGNGGLCIILNHIEFEFVKAEKREEPEKREGAENDGTLLTNLFKLMGFKSENIHCWTNLTYDQIYDSITDIFKSIEKFSCVAVCVSTHGLKNGYICAKNRKYELKNLFGWFQKEEKLNGKPKLFFIQACLGEREDGGCIVPSEGDVDTAGDGEHSPDPIRDREVTNSYPKENNFLVHFSTVPGYVSIRNTVKGSYFFSVLDYVLRMSLKAPKGEKNLTSLLTLVNRIIASKTFELNKKNEVVDRKVQPSIYDSLQHAIILNGSSLVDGLKNEDASVLKNSHKTAITFFEDEAKNEFYSMSHKRRGVCIIFNHDTFEEDVLKEIPLGARERNGTNMDAKLFEETFSALNFEVRKIKHNKTRKQIMKKIEKIRDENHAEADCFVCVVLTSSTYDGRLCALDDDYDFEELFEPFYGDKCKTLRGKPKMFIIQSCYKSSRVYHDGGKNAPFIERTIPITSDILVYRSNVAGSYTWSNNKPSFFALHFTNALKELFKSENQNDLCSLLPVVNAQVTNDLNDAIDFEVNTKIQQINLNGRERERKIQDIKKGARLQEEEQLISNYRTLNHKVKFAPK